MDRIGSQVDEFAGVGCEIVEFLDDELVVFVVGADELVGLGADGIVRLSAEGGFDFGGFVVKVVAPRGVGIIEKGFEIESLMVGRRFQSGEFSEERREIDVEGEFGFGAGREAGALDEERDSDRFFISEDLRRELVGTGLPAVVAHENDPGVAGD